MTDIVKIDANFLERGLFALDRQYNERSFQSADGKFEIVCSATSVPVDVDHAVLIFLLHSAQNSVDENGEWEKVLSPTFLDILKGVGKNRPGKADYDRVRESLYRYSTARIEFHESFYERDQAGRQNRVSKSFSILSYEIDETGRPVIALDEIFLRQLRRTKFYRNLSFTEYRKLTQPLARRLFELLEKWTMSQDEWTIDARGLGKSLHMSERAASQIIKRVEAAIAKVNKATCGRYEMVAEKVRHGVFNLTFSLVGERFSVNDELEKKAKKKAKKTRTESPLKPETPVKTLSSEVLEALPEESRNDKTVTDLLAPLSTDEAVALIEHCKRKAQSKPIGYLVGIAKRNNLKTVAAGLSKNAAMAEALDGFTAEEISMFSRTWRYICNDGDESIREQCAQGGIDYDRLTAWVAATNKAQG
ncbi:replication initiator protein A [Pseudodesulfovibrio thermohalotolerans]|jgi:hypothetical protein|uniref:replication initiator protein A n=1 Tax=Pseudodesulfovibrio thermohalotolerans TaxID=2880651 RepID=UPI00244247D4|nr:replication initiator protein A [Pseudodesulfovibrio thermohalotolerans]WFS63826.1 replication initiator protein A [Pseudodesulfovibrio thermohalotolerans]